MIHLLFQCRLVIQKASRKYYVEYRIKLRCEMPVKSFP